MYRKDHYISRANFPNTSLATDRLLKPLQGFSFPLNNSEARAGGYVDL